MSICRYPPQTTARHIVNGVDYRVLSLSHADGLPIRGKVCVADDRPRILSIVTRILRDSGRFSVLEAEDDVEAGNLIGEENPDVVVLSIRMAGGRQLLRRAVTATPPLPVVIVAKYSTVEQAASSMQLGVFDYVLEPVDANDLLTAVHRALERKQMLGPVSAACGEDLGFGGLVGSSRVMQRVFDQIRQAAPYKSTVLITGESGTGKDLVASAIHSLSAVRNGPYVPVNCAALPSELVESMFFGHEKGSFTGATGERKGFFEAAHGGTLFLDEIGGLSMQAQTKLLRALEEHRVRRLGASKLVEVDVRIVAASNSSIPDAIRSGRFREDLYYRLNVIPINVPSLRERKSDIPLLVRIFTERFAEQNGVSHIEIADHCLKQMADYDWPGNVRELKNIAERLVIFRPDGTSKISHEQIAAIMPTTDISSTESKVRGSGIGHRTLGEHERVLILNTLEHTGGNRTHAADLLGISLRTLQRKLKQYRMASR